MTRSMGAADTGGDDATAEPFEARAKREVLREESCFPDAASCRRRMFR